MPFSRAVVNLQSSDFLQFFSVNGKNGESTTSLSSHNVTPNISLAAELRREVDY